MAYNEIIAPRIHGLHEAMDKMRAQMQARLASGMRDFTLDIARLVGLLLDNNGKDEASFYKLSLVEYASLYRDNASLSPVAWPEISTVINNYIDGSVLVKNMANARVMYEFLSEQFDAFNVNAPDHRGITPLMMAASVDSGQCNLIASLLELGADVNASHETYGQPLHFIRHAGRAPAPEVLTTLIKGGANPLDETPFVRYGSNDATQHISFADYVRRIEYGSMRDHRGQELLDCVRLILKQFEDSAAALDKGQHLTVERRKAIGM